jgi:hypothetical protein
LNDYLSYLVILKITTNTIKMQRNHQSNYFKPKTMHPITFSISSTEKTNHRAHCRSLVDLQELETSSKENNHFCQNLSIIPNSNDDHKGMNKLNTNSKSNRTTLANSKNLCNITKILLHAKRSKSKQNIDILKGNPLFQTTNTQPS